MNPADSNILILSSSYPPVVGGLQTVTHTLARSLKARGHKVRVITNKYPRTLPSSNRLDGVSVLRWHFLIPRLQQVFSLRLDLFLAGLIYFPLTLARLFVLLKRERPSVVNLHFLNESALFLWLVSRFIPFRLIVSLHGDDVEGLSQRGRFDLFLFRAVLRRADVLTACSGYLLNRALEIEPQVTPKGRVIYNGMDQETLMQSTPERTSIIAVGRMVPKKGFDVLIKALAQCKCEAVLTLVGDGPERKRLEQLARDLALNGRVRFTGAMDRTEMLRKMGSGALVVIPSLAEPFGMVALEAMASGKPVVASRVGGLPEVLKDADTILVTAGEVAQLASAIEMGLEKVSQNPKFGARNRESVAKFSTRKMVDDYLSAYYPALS